MKRKTRSRKPGIRMIQIPDCKHFTGYKPCVPGSTCLDECVDPQPCGTSILIVNLEAMGNVLVTTSLLPAIKRKYPRSTISWITLKNAFRLLDHNPFVDRVYVWEPESWLKLQSLQFDVVMNFDKAIASAALIMSLNATTKLGYGLNNRSVIIPLNREAEYNYRLGLDDNLKFRLNQKPNTQLLAEAVGLKYERDEYVLKLSIEETRFCDAYRQRIEFSGHSTFSHASISNSSEPVRGPDNIGGDEIASRRRRDRRSPMIVGFNTGCSLLFPNKKMTIDQHVILIDELSKRDGLRILLLGGPEDAERNAEIVRRVGDKVVGTPTMEGIRRGICYENLCDVIITGDSFGMHVAIALKKYVIVWFGVSCPQEIDLYDRGVKLIPEGLSCSPCWKRECPYQLECIQMIDLDRIIKEVDLYRDNISALGAGEQRP